MSIVINKVNGKSNILMWLYARKNARTSSKRRRTCIRDYCFSCDARNLTSPFLVDSNAKFSIWISLNGIQ